MGGKDRGRALVVCGRERAGERDAHVGVEAGAPHKDEVLTKLVEPSVLCITVFGGVGRIEEELESLTETLACVEVLELIGEEGSIDVGRKLEEAARICGGGRGRCTVGKGRWGAGRGIEIDAKGQGEG